jgi:hypothetical protein
MLSKDEWDGAPRFQQVPMTTLAPVSIPILAQTTGLRSAPSVVANRLPS